MSRFIDLTGKTFGELHVDSYAGDLKWNCTCSCGKQLVVGGQSLRRGDRTSCGHTRGLARRTEDLEGMQFGDWTVLKRVKGSNYLCQCSCENKTQRIINAYELKTGKTRSCGHNTTGFKDLTGKKFGEWTAQRYLGAGKWLCKCSCGKEGEVARAALLSGQSKSCGHATNAIVDLTGRTFGSLKVLRHVGYGRWECQCSCGNITVVRHTELLNGDSKSCGCKQDYYRRNTLLDKYGTVAYSRAETEIKEYIDSLGVSLDIVLGCRDALENFEIDVYIPSIKFGIEYDGSYWHSDINKDRFYHFYKTSKAIKNGIRLIHIHDYEWRHGDVQKIIKGLIKTEIIQRMVQCNIDCDLTKKGFIQSEYDIRKIDNEQATEFTSKYNVFGVAKFTTAFGAYYNDSIIAVILIKSENNGYYSIQRITQYPGIKFNSVVEHIVKYIISDIKPTKLTFEVQLDKFTGECLFKLGFRGDKKSIIAPKYVVYSPVGNKLISRAEVEDKIKPLKEMGIHTESAIDACNYYRVYNSGSVLLEWTPIT